MAETSLHQELKAVYADADSQLEVPWDGGYRIDVVAGETLVEIQHSSLSSIRPKIRQLVKRHRVLVVKPLVVRKRLIKRSKQDGPVVDRRLSPKRGSLLDLFDELVHFTDVFPHKNLVLEVPLVETEEWRYPGHGRRRRRRREGDFVVEDVKLVKIERIYCFRTAADLKRDLELDGLPERFHTGDLAEALGVDRWIAQRIAYCWRKMGTATAVGKQGNAHVYTFKNARRRRAG